MMMKSLFWDDTIQKMLTKMERKEKDFDGMDMGRRWGDAGETS